MNELTPRETCRAASVSRYLLERLSIPSSARSLAVAICLLYMISGRDLRTIIGPIADTTVLAIIAVLASFLLAKSGRHFLRMRRNAKQLDRDDKNIDEIESWHEATEWLSRLEDTPVVGDLARVALLREQVSGIGEILDRTLKPGLFPWIIAIAPAGLIPIIAFYFNDHLALLFSLRLAADLLFGIAFFVYLCLLEAKSSILEIQRMTGVARQAISLPAFQASEQAIRRVQHLLASKWFQTWRRPEDHVQG